MTKEEWNHIGSALAGPLPIVFVDVNKVNMDDLMDIMPGRIVRVLDMDGVRVLDDFRRTA